jgi:hypothetical protein
MTVLPSRADLACSRGRSQLRAICGCWELAWLNRVLLRKRTSRLQPFAPHGQRPSVNDHIKHGLRPGLHERVCYSAVDIKANSSVHFARVGYWQLCVQPTGEHIQRIADSLL